MTNSNKTLLALSLLALAACGGDDDKGTAPFDGGPPVKVSLVDGGVPGTGTPGTGTPGTGTPGTGDGGTPGVVTPMGGSDAGNGTATPGGDCFMGTPVQMVDFLNRCTTSQTTTKTLAVPPGLLTAGGGVVAL